LVWIICTVLVPRCGSCLGIRLGRVSERLCQFCSPFFWLSSLGTFSMNSLSWHPTDFVPKRFPPPRPGNPPRRSIFPSQPIPFRWPPPVRQDPPSRLGRVSFVFNVSFFPHGPRSKRSPDDPTSLVLRVSPLKRCYFFWTSRLGCPTKLSLPGLFSPLCRSRPGLTPMLN